MQGITLSPPRQNPFGERYFYEVNHLAFDKQPSESIFKRYYADLLEKEENLYVVVGSDSGLLYQFIKEQQLPKNVKFIFIDFSEVNKASGLLADVNEIWNGSIRLVNTDFKFGRIADEFNNYVVRRKIHLIKSLAVMDAESNSPYYELWKKLEIDFISFRRSEFNAQSTKVFEVERILNAADNMYPVSAINGCLRGKDVLVLGGGPTLDDAIDWIRDNQQQLVIFAAARVAKRMAREGITPDFFVTVDPFDWSFDNSKHVLAFSETSLLINSFHAQHKIIGQWNGVSLYAGPRYGWKVEGAKPNIDAPGPTVTNAALHIACSLGAQRVFLSGIDFCFAKGKTHEAGSQEAQMSDTYGFHTRSKVEDNAGLMTETSDDFYSGLRAMQNAIQMYLSARKMEFFSLGLHSAKIQNVGYIAPADVVLTNEPKSEWSLELRQKLDMGVEQRQQFAQQTVTELESQLKRFQKLHELAEKGASYTPKIYDEKTHALKSKPAAQVSKLRKKIDTLIGADGDMLMNYQAAFFYDSFKPIEDEKNMSRDEVVEQLTAFFSGVGKASQHFLEALEKGVSRASLRANELGNKIKPCELYAEWEKWYEFGRAEQWRIWHAGESLNDEETICLHKALANFKAEYEKQDHNYLSRLKRRISNVSTLFARANHAYDTKNLTEISGLIEHAETLDANDAKQKQSFIYYLNGLQSELLEQYEEASANYLKVEMPFFRQQALKKLLNIKMTQEDYDSCLVLLEQLCRFSLDYMIPYADLLGLLGQKNMSVEVLKLYIANKPDNHLVRIKLAQLQMEVGLLDDALLVLDEVLASDPNNKTALFLKSQAQSKQ